MGELAYYTDPMPALLPVFFGKKDAALLDSAKFELMAELNPQLKQSLQLLATSAPLTNAVICLKQTGWTEERFRQDVTQAMRELHLTPAGLQILMLFKVQQLVSFEPSHLDTLRQLREK
ncbi:MAG: PhnD/SsuA/transferrin family substrate-binding protein [Syntrophotaleaceae bacterium]